MSVTVEELFAADVTQRDVEEINILARQLSPDAEPLTLVSLRSLTLHHHLFVARARGKLVGMVTLIVYSTPTNDKGRIEDVVVHAKYRGRGIGRLLMQFAITEAQSRNLKGLTLTSNLSRVEAGKLYESLGFVERDTRTYRLTFR